MSLTLQACQHLDVQDPLRPLRDLFDIPPGMIYLDGNSLGALPRATAPRLQAVVQQEWGVGLIRSYNTAQWFEQPHLLGDRLAPWLGAGEGEVVVTDTTSVNLYKVLSVAMAMATQDRPQQRVLLSEQGNFPTDLYMAESLCAQHGWQLRCVPAGELAQHLTPEVGVLMLTHVHYRTGSMWDMALWSQRAHDVGALAVWDLAHSAGAVPLALKADHADFAVGCGYKYLNGGPGAPAYMYAAPRIIGSVAQPIPGWFGHAEPFAFEDTFRPAPGIARFSSGTTHVLSMKAMHAALGVINRYPIDDLRTTCIRLGDFFVEGYETFLSTSGFELGSQREGARRGGHIALLHPDAERMSKELIARSLIVDYRPPNVIRIAFSPLFLRFTDVARLVGELSRLN